MSTTRIPPAATVLLLLFLSVAVAAASPMTDRGDRYSTRFHGLRSSSSSRLSVSLRGRFRYRYRYKYNYTAPSSSFGGSSSSPPGGPRKLAREFLNAHNKVRVEKGQPLLKWDAKLARTARRWGSERRNDCEMRHSSSPYGENLFWGGRDHWTPTEVVESWAKEQDYYNVLSNGCEAGQMCGHYTQIVWRSTAKVGCARQKCTGGGVLVICNYDPPGNYINENPFGLSTAGADQSNPS
ncbi:hypothetical protein Ddye_015145 [Dipteronia dyeriana]|uniref:SCP domain-containing protein n=1 Tax=Dipteronia dyeriana TaxID=168575 RepID=A0AAD9WY82_9ROSI|nr:hypothetical protein Ddye_015145 [Dipteronia dyeriana]